MNRKIIVLFFAFNLLTTFGFAQSKPETTPVGAPTGLALEVTSVKTSSPTYVSVPRTDVKAGAHHFLAFRLIADFRLPPGDLPVRAVNIIPQLEKDAVKIAVSVFRGQKFYDREEAVTTFSLRENERITVKELAAFGVEPFEISLVRVTPTVSALPTVVNRTDSLQVTGIEPYFSTLPAYKVTLLNSSAKAVSAFVFETQAEDGRVLLSGMPHGLKGETLIEPGGTFERKISNSMHKTRSVDGQPPPVHVNQKFVLVAVVFADGSYEGDPGNAAIFRGFVLGRKSQLKKMTNFLPENLERQTANLKFTMDENAFADLLKEFPSLNEKEKSDLRIAVETAARSIEKDFLQSLERVRSQNPETLRSWLLDMNETHRRWLKRLN